MDLKKPSSTTHLIVFFFNDPATTEISPLPLHDALPICPAHLVRVSAGSHAGLSPAAPGGHVNFPSTAAWRAPVTRGRFPGRPIRDAWPRSANASADRKSTRLNSSHGYISYAVFCLNNKN